MAEYSSERVTIANCEIEVLSGGEGPPLLFLHGAGGAAGWMPYMSRLARHHALSVPSHPGFGRSETPDWLDGIGDLAYFYLEYLDSCFREPVHLVGNSLGGWLALEIAVRSTTRVRSLTLVSSAGIHLEGVPKGDIFLWSEEERAYNTFHDRDMAQARLARQPTEEEAAIALKNHFSTARIAWHPRFYNPELQKWLHRIKVPTLILWGDSDRIFPPAYGDALHSLIPGSRLAIISACGHLPQQEQLDAFEEHVIRHTSGGTS